VVAFHTDGILPAGHLSEDFPSNSTRSSEVPDDLDTQIYIENSQLMSVPLAITRLESYYLALTGSPIVELPPGSNRSSRET
jgi:hypothetical protein